MSTRTHVTMKPATVIGVNDDGTYLVLPDSGRGSGQPIDGVRTVIETDLETGDRVVLFWERPGEHPRILVTGNSDRSAYWQGYRDAGYWGAVAD